ncbi:MAG: hypothetical protein P4L92_19485 [Rudaea sp.]|nr:hypothetical protein [Rudaea sp.]
MRALMLLCEMHLHLMHKLAFHSFIQLAADVVAQLERRPGGFVLTDPSDVSVAIRVRFYNQVGPRAGVSVQIDVSCVCLLIASVCVPPIKKGALCVCVAHACARFVPAWL